ncbi:MAG: MotA/TolQ/ExbB proton channel family protein [Desulfopila sp.]
MKLFLIVRFLPLLITLTISVSTATGSEDMRILQGEFREALHNLKQKAMDEEESAKIEAAKSRNRISGDRGSLEQAILRVETEVKSLETAVAALETEDRELDAQETEILANLATTDSVVRELVGVIRITAKDVETLISGNLQSGLIDTRTDFLQAISVQAQFPGIADIKKMNEVIGRQLQEGGSVRMTRGTIVDRTGNTTEAEILVIGTFTAAYRIDDEVGFLSYSPAGRKLFALSTLPSRKQQKQLLHYMDGQHEAVPMDISRGAALRQLTQNLSLWQQIGKGGPLVWPIIAILVVGILIVIERVFFLYRRNTDADALTKRVEEQVMQQNRHEAVEECARLNNKPVARVMAAGLAFSGMQREIMENGLQEAILREIPPLERFLSTLAMLAAIAPLLGLLGTVTGMIDTFYVITQHGTGDPRMMSGGISIALVTTMLGLSVAIPIMLAHTLINRTVDNRIAEMEEKAVALINIVHKQSYAGN